MDQHDEKSLMAEVKKKGLKPDKSWGKGKLADELFKEFVRPKLINPTYLINHPIELSPLSKKLKDRPAYVERFQLIVGGTIELMNAFSELNDPLDQEERFKFQAKLIKAGDKEGMGKDDEFVEALKYGLPPTAGLGMGIDHIAGNFAYQFEQEPGETNDDDDVARRSEIREQVAGMLRELLQGEGCAREPDQYRQRLLSCGNERVVPEVTGAFGYFFGVMQGAPCEEVTCDGHDEDQHQADDFRTQIVWHRFLLKAIR